MGLAILQLDVVGDWALISSQSLKAGGRRVARRGCYRANLPWQQPVEPPPTQFPELRSARCRPEWHLRREAPGFPAQGVHALIEDAFLDQPPARLGGSQKLNPRPIDQVSRARGGVLISVDPRSDRPAFQSYPPAIDREGQERHGSGPEHIGVLEQGPAHADVDE